MPWKTHIDEVLAQPRIICCGIERFKIFTDNAYKNSFVALLGGVIVVQS